MSAPELVETVGLGRPYTFSDTPIRPLSSAFTQDTQAYVKDDRYELSLDLCGCRVPGTSVLPRASTCGH